MPVLYGVFLYMGCAALRGMQVCLFILFFKSREHLCSQNSFAENQIIRDFYLN